jgi:Flp pilus assembly protein TadD
LALYDMLRVGASFSGRERHCAFLNTRDGRFADVSAVSGFDLPEDGRAVARCDWDQDGDEDLWITNRSGPMLRLMLNDSTPSGSWLRIRLIANGQNRDAIGARVELAIQGSSAPMRQEVVAGDGFLSQSSPWLTFRLAAGEAIESLRVHWPGAASENFDGWRAGATFLLRQDSGVAESFELDRKVPKLASEQASGEPASSLGVHSLTEAVPMPRLRYESFSGAALTWSPAPQSSGTVLTLWSKDCAACLHELKSWSAQAETLASAGIEVLALSLEDPHKVEPDARRQAAEIISRLHMPFSAGLATADTLELIRVLRERTFPRYTPLVLPTSLVLDESGAVCAIASGPLSIERALEEVRHARDSASDKRARSMLFEGRWMREPSKRQLQLFVRELVAAGLATEAVDLLDAYRERLRAEPQFARFASELALSLMDAGHDEQALPYFESTLSVRPKNARTRFNFAVALERLERNEAAIEQYRRLIAHDAADFKSTFQLGTLLHRLERWEECDESLTRAVELRPESAESLELLAKTYAATGEIAQARALFRRAAELFEAAGSPERAQHLRELAQR